jgi:hypothetical protein
MFQIEAIDNKMFYLVTIKSEMPQILAINNKMFRNEAINNKTPDLIINKISYLATRK